MHIRSFFHIHTKYPRTSRTVHSCKCGAFRINRTRFHLVLRIYTIYKVHYTQFYNAALVSCIDIPFHVSCTMKYRTRILRSIEILIPGIVPLRLAFKDNFRYYAYHLVY